MTQPFQRVTVLGAGTMGHGIAYVCAVAGIDTVLYDVDLGAVDDGLKLIRAEFDRACSLGKLTDSDEPLRIGPVGFTRAGVTVDHAR